MNRVVAITIVVCAVFVSGLILLLVVKTDKRLGIAYPQHAVAMECRPSSSPIYHFISRMELMKDNPETAAFVFERGGLFQLVKSENVKMFGNEPPVMFVEIDGIYWGLIEPKK